MKNVSRLILFSLIFVGVGVSHAGSVLFMKRESACNSSNSNFASTDPNMVKANEACTEIDEQVCADFVSQAKPYLGRNLLEAATYAIIPPLAGALVYRDEFDLHGPNLRRNVVYLGTTYIISAGLGFIFTTVKTNDAEREKCIDNKAWNRSTVPHSFSWEPKQYISPLEITLQKLKIQRTAKTERDSLSTVRDSLPK